MGCCGSSDTYELKIEILSASGLPDVDIIGKIDPYVLTKYNGEEFKTKKKKGDSVKWEGDDDDAEYLIEDGKRGQHDIIFTLMDKDTFTKDDYIGTAVLRKADQNIDYNVPKIFDLSLDQRGESKGMLKVQITFKHEGENPEPFTLNNDPGATQQVYGGDQTVVNQTTVVKKTVIVEETVVVKRKKIIKDGVEMYEDEVKDDKPKKSGKNKDGVEEYGDEAAGDEAGDEAAGDEAAGDGADAPDGVDMYGGAEPQDDEDLPPESGTKVLSDDNVYEFPIYEYNKEDRWLSSKKARTDDMITIVTQCSIDRLPQLRSMCQAWSGIISVAIYIKENVELCKERLNELFHEMERCYSVVLDISLLYENNLDRTDSDGVDVLYPINHLRNLALDNASSELVFLLDVDFVPSLNMHEMLINNDMYKDALNVSKKANLALVIPAFEINTNDTSIVAHPRTKADIMNMVSLNNASPFHVERFAFGHRNTNYNYWYKSNEIYGIEYELMYEPYIIIKRQGLRKYDERYRGYGMNKIVHIAGLAMKDNIKFAVLPNIFVSASEHKKSTAYKQIFGKPRNVVRRNKNFRRKLWLKQLWKISLCELMDNNDNNNNDLITQINVFDVEKDVRNNVVNSWTNNAIMC